MTGDALFEWINDITVSGISERASGWKYVVYREPGGTQRGTSTDGSDKSQDSGKWMMVGDDTYCSQWKNWNEGKKTCYQVYAGDSDEYFTITTDGKFWSSEKFDVSREQGNAKNL